MTYAGRPVVFMYDWLETAPRNPQCLLSKETSHQRIDFPRQMTVVGTAVFICLDPMQFSSHCGNTEQ